MNAGFDEGLFEGLSNGIPEDVKAQILGELKEFESKGFVEDSPLKIAVGQDDLSNVQRLLQDGADPNQKDFLGRTPISFASTPEVLRTLVESGAELEARSEFGWTALVNAILDGEIDRARLLLDAGADVHVTWDHGFTTFMSAAGSMGRSAAMLDLLVEFGVDPHAISEHGWNSWHAAIDVSSDANTERSVMETYAALRRLGVDIEHRNKAGETPLGRAIFLGTAIEVRGICQMGANVEALTTVSTCSGDECERFEATPLLALVSGMCIYQAEKGQALLDAGANVHATNREGHRALEVAVGQLCEEAAEGEDKWSEFWHSVSFPADVRRWAHSIPIEDESEYGPRFREDQVQLIELLLGAEAR